MEDPMFHGKPQAPAEAAAQGQAAARPSERHSWGSDTIRCALLEASRIKLEAFQSGERMYEDLVKAARVTADEIVAEARQEAHRILAEANREASLLRQDRGSCVSEAAIEALRGDVAALVRHLRVQVDDPNLTSSVPESLTTLGPPPDGSRGTAPRLASDVAQFMIRRGPGSSGETPSVRTLPPETAPENPPQGIARTWAPPEWISAE